jgi:murein DD-endopeptidase MepM/ murein hydrolase activator NlpD
MIQRERTIAARAIDCKRSVQKMTISRVAVLFSAVLGFATPAVAADPRPPQVEITFLAEPAPILQNGATKLVYEMFITNFSKQAYVLDAIEATAGASQFSFTGTALAGMMTHVGIWDPATNPGGRTIGAGKTSIVFLMLDLDDSKAPRSLAHSLHILDDKGGAHDIVPSPLPVSDESPTIVAPPLRGVWIAGDSVNNAADAAHRRAILITDGRPWLSQRYAIDWVQTKDVDGVTATWKGPEDKNDSYFCYDQPIYSVAAGKVVGMSDGMPENVPHSGQYAVPITFDNAAGNHVVVEIAPRRFVLYAHMRPGTVRVKVGDTIGVGYVIGHVGNTGSSTEPHLHMHIDDHPSFLAGNGVPYGFTAFEASGPVEANVSTAGAISIGPIGPQKPFTNDYPANNAEVTFH